MQERAELSRAVHVKLLYSEVLREEQCLILNFLNGKNAHTFSFCLLHDGCFTIFNLG